MNSSSEDSDSPMIDEETGLPILLLGSSQPVPKLTYTNTVRIDPARKRPRSYRRKKAKGNEEITRGEETRRGDNGDVVAEQSENVLTLTATVATYDHDVDDDLADDDDDDDDDGELGAILESHTPVNFNAVLVILLVLSAWTIQKPVWKLNLCALHLCSIARNNT